MNSNVLYKTNKRGKFMKRLFLIAMLTISMAFFGCQNKSEKKDDTNKTEVTETTENKNEKKDEKKESKDEKKDEKKETAEKPLDENTKKELLDKAKNSTALLQEKKFDEFKKNISDNFKKATEGQDLDVFTMLEKELGAFKGVKSSEVKQMQGRTLVDSRLEFEKGTVDQFVAFDDKNAVDGINYLNMLKYILPEEGETAVTVDAGTGFPVDGMIKMPKGEVKAAVVLVDGSGPSDMNFRLGDNKMMKNLSDQLADKGVAVLRFNKRTYQYAKEIAEKGMQNKVLVKDEFIDDAAAALKLLAKTDGVPKDKIFLLGHSQSAAYLPAINKESGNIAKGYILASGTPKNIAEVSKLQYEEIIKSMDKEKQKDQIASIEGKYKEYSELLKKVPTMSDEELKKPENYPFGIPGEYIKDSMKYEPLKMYKETELPVLIRNAEFDKQVPVSETKTWEEALKGKDNVDIGTIKGANHLMQPSDGSIGIMEVITKEYQKNAPIVDQFINDVVQFMEKNTK